MKRPIYAKIEYEYVSKTTGNKRRSIIRMDAFRNDTWEGFNKRVDKLARRLKGKVIGLSYMDDGNE